MDLSNSLLADFTIKQETFSKRKTVYGIGIIIGIACSWVGSTQFAKSAYTSNFNAPFFIIWFTTTWMSLVFPITTIAYCLVKGENFKKIYNKGQELFGSRGVCPYTLFTRCLPFTILWCACNYMYTRALSQLPATDVTALFSSAPAFVFIFSILVLPGEYFSWRKLCATLISITGIVLIAYSNGFQSPTITGVILAIASAVLAAIYKVFFKFYINETTRIEQISLFLTSLGLINFLAFWPIMEILYFTGAEHIRWYQIPWNYLTGSAALSLCFNFLINFGIAYTFPLFISLGTVIGIPLNAVVDAIWRNKSFPVWEWIGSILIILGFILMSWRRNDKERNARPRASSPKMNSVFHVQLD